MRVTFVIPFVHLTGGIRVHLDYANELSAAGHDVTIAYPSWPYRFQYTWREQVEEFRRNMQNKPSIEWYTLQAKLIRIPAIRTWWLPQSDVVVAVSWPTVRDVSRLHRSRGRKVHIVMHHESGTGPEDKIKQNYRMPFYRIGYSRSIAEQMRDEFDCEVHDVVPNGINTRVFYAESIHRNIDTVLMLYHPDPRKGANDGLYALTQLCTLMPNLRVHLCGTVRPVHSLTQRTQFTFHPSDKELRNLYNSSTAFLYPSRIEGFGLPPLEAMACRCPVVTTAVGAIPEYTYNGINAFVIQPGDTRSMVDRLANLLNDSKLRAQFVAEGLKTAARYSLQCVAPLFEAALLKAMDS